MNHLFGTDGVRGRANQELTPELSLALARAVAEHLLPERGRVIIGRDTRTSGPMLEGTLAAGFSACGADVFLAGVIPTPAIAFLIKDEHADLGAVISASHNQPEDNGIKFFDRQGRKLTLSQEEAIENYFSKISPQPGPVGRIVPLEAAASRYAAFLAGTIEIEEIDLDGRTIVVDCAYGATGAIAPRVLRHFNARVIELHTLPDGMRINQECGSTHLAPLRAAVLEHHANLGIAFDGDGDRVLLVSPTGEKIDGDRMIGIAAIHLQQKGSLDPAIVVATVMSNLGLEEALKKAGIEMVRTPVGDRNVAQAMLAHGAKIGGEQSGHIIFSDHSPTGDGILTAVKLLEIAHECGIDLHTLAKEIPLYPQVQHDIAVSDPTACLNLAAVQDAIAVAESHLEDCGRLIVRASGTQPLVRVLVEGKDEALCNEVCTELAAVIEETRQRCDAEKA
jgi:phosphoglucosamine mutase